MATLFITDGGRSAAGFKGSTGDCVCRAIAIANDISYLDAYQLINDHSKIERKSKNRKSKSSARTGVYKATIKRILADLGWIWVPTMKIGSGCKVHLKDSELPEGTLIVQVSKHLTTVIDGIIHDTYDPSRNGTRCVYGYWTKSK